MSELFDDCGKWKGGVSGGAVLWMCDHTASSCWPGAFTMVLQMLRDKIFIHIIFKKGLEIYKPIDLPNDIKFYVWIPVSISVTIIYFAFHRSESNYTAICISSDQSLSTWSLLFLMNVILDMGNPTTTSQDHKKIWMFSDVAKGEIECWEYGEIGKYFYKNFKISFILKHDFCCWLRSIFMNGCI